jgi:hypothetical protein
VIERLTSRVGIAVEGDALHVVPCSDGDALVVALVPCEGLDHDGLTVTHVARGWNAMGDHVFPASGTGLDAALGFRDDLLALPIAWGTFDPDPVASGCLDKYREIRRRASIWIQHYWIAQEGDE